MTRRNAREWAVQILFELDLNPRDDLEAVFSNFWQDRQHRRSYRGLTERWVRGVCEQRAVLDEIIARHAQHWSLSRMAVTDRNVLRLAIYEMAFCPDIPNVVSINEAVDLAKFFNTNESGRFVNGILDSARKELARNAGEAPNPPQAS